MGFFNEISFNFKSLYIVAPTALLATSALAGMQVVYIDGKAKDAGTTPAPQVFRATEEDGTAKVIHANTKVDEQKPADEYMQPEAPTTAPVPTSKPKAQTAAAAPAPAPTPVPAQAPAEETTPVNSEIAELKRQNVELQKRLVVLEQARSAQKADSLAQAQAAQTATPAPVQAQAPAAPAEEKDESVEAAPTPTDTVDARMKEKALVSKTTKSELAKQQTAEQKQNELLARAEQFDQVPDQRIPDIALRLKYTNEILKRFGRAYDYRLMTLSQLKKTLNELDQAEEKTKTAN